MLTWGRGRWVVSQKRMMIDLCCLVLVETGIETFRAESLSKDDGDVNENGKKAIDLINKNNNFSLHLHRPFFIHFFAVFAQLRLILTNA